VFTAAMFCFKITIGLSSPESPWKPTFGFRVDEVFIGSLRMEPKPTEINTGILRSLINVSHLISNNDMELTPAQTPPIISVMIHNSTLKERVQTFSKRQETRFLIKQLQMKLSGAVMICQ